MAERGGAAVAGGARPGVGRQETVGRSQVTVLCVLRVSVREIRPDSAFAIRSPVRYYNL